jgi:hypothetical protein
MHLKGLHLIGVHLTGLHLIGAYISQNVHLRCLYLMGVALSRAHFTGVHLEAAVPKPAVPELCPQPISRPIVSPDTSRLHTPIVVAEASSPPEQGCRPLPHDLFFS